MMILALLTLLLITNGSAEEEMVKTVLGFTGHNVLLPCGCSNVHKLVWQRGERVVSFYQEGKSSPIDQDYIDRTENFLRMEKTNCSLKILNISSADEGAYTCHALVSVAENVWSRKALTVNLTVSEDTVVIPTRDFIVGVKPVTAVCITVPILAVLLLAVAVILILLIKRRHRTNTDPDLPAQQPMIKIV